VLVIVLVILIESNWPSISRKKTFKAFKAGQLFYLARPTRDAVIEYEHAHAHDYGHEYEHEHEYEYEHEHEYEYEYEYGHTHGNAHELLVDAAFLERFNIGS